MLMKLHYDIQFCAIAWLQQFIHVLDTQFSTIVLTGTGRMAFERVINMFDTSNKDIKTHDYI